MTFRHIFMNKVHHNASNIAGRPHEKGTETSKAKGRRDCGGRAEKERSASLATTRSPSTQDEATLARRCLARGAALNLKGPKLFAQVAQDYNAEVDRAWGSLSGRNVAAKSYVSFTSAGHLRRYFEETGRRSAPFRLGLEAGRAPSTVQGGQTRVDGPEVSAPRMSAEEAAAVFLNERKPPSARSLRHTLRKDYGVSCGNSVKLGDLQRKLRMALESSAEDQR